MKVHLQISIRYIVLLLFCLVLAACNLPGQASQGGAGQSKNNDEGKEWLGEELPTPTLHAGKVGSGTVKINSFETGRGSQSDVAILVPFDILFDKQGHYQIVGKYIGNATLELKGTGCKCNGAWQVESEINGTIEVKKEVGCDIVFSETRTWMSGECWCDCPGDRISCDNVFPDIDDFGPFTVEFDNGSKHVEMGGQNGVLYDHMWVFQDLELNTTDCFVSDKIELSP